jgi:acetyl-CoA C-acetyltransferase
MRDVAVVGVGMNKWGELWGTSLRDIFVEAALKAMDDAGVDRIDSLYVGCMSPGLFVGQEHLASLLADYLGQCPIPAVRVESACASGGMALRMGWMDVALGLHDIVMVSGIEKMLDVDGAGATYALATAADQEFECYNGATFPGLYAMIANAYQKKHRIAAERFRDQLAHVAVKNHANGHLNPNAQYRAKLTLDDVKNATMVADPLLAHHRRCGGGHSLPAGSGQEEIQESSVSGGHRHRRSHRYHRSARPRGPHVAAFHGGRGPAGLPHG